MTNLFIMYKLRPDVKMEDFMEFSRNRDRPLVLKQDCVHKFDVYEMKGSRAGVVHFDIVEHLQVESWEEFKKLSDLEEVKKNGIEFKKHVDTDTVKVLHGNQA